MTIGKGYKRQEGTFESNWYANYLNCGNDFTEMPKLFRLYNLNMYSLFSQLYFTKAIKNKIRKIF